MADPKLLNYIKTQAGKGHTQDEIRQALLQAGWNPPDIDAAFNDPTLRTVQAKPPPGKPPSRPPSSSSPAQPVQQSQQPSQPAQQPQAKAQLQQPQQLKGKPTQQSSQPTQQKQSQAKPAQTQAKQPQPQPGDEISLGLISRFWMILRHPNTFFDEVKSEQGFQAPLKYFVFLMLLQMLITNVTMYISISLGSFVFPASAINPILTLLPQLGINDILNANIAIVLNIAVFIGIAAYFHIFVRIFGGKGNLMNSIRVVFYSYTPFPILSIITIPLTFYYLMSVYDTIATMTPELTGDILMSLMNIMFVQIIFMLVFLAWAVILGVKSSSKFHEMSLWKAFGAILISVMVLIVFTVLVLGAIYAMLVVSLL